MMQSKSKSTRYISIAIAVIFMLVSILASTETASAASRLKVSVTKKTVYVGQTTKFKSNKNVKWSVSNKKIAKLTVTKKRTATLKGLKAGTVYVRAKYGKTTRKIKIVVKKKKGPTKINLLSTRSVIGRGENCVVFVDSVVPSSQSMEVNFYSSDKDIAVVSPAGLVTGTGEGEVTITAKSKVNSTKASIKLTVVASKAGVLTATIDMTDEEKYPAGKVVKAWFQVPVSDENQTIYVVDNSAPYATVEKFIKDSSGAKAYYLEWDETVAPENRTASISFHVFRRSVLNSNLKSKEKGTVDSVKYAEWLRPTTFSGLETDGMVEKLAADIVSDAGATTVYDKAHAIYLWICDNITRDKTKANRELGDVATILAGDRVAGSCIDINSIFVALCNAEEIPARESFGYKIYEGSSDVTGTKLGQNCRAEFYLPGYGWVEVDPAMPLGRVMNGAVSKDDTAVWESVKDTYWTTGSPDWICQNHGRDLTFEAPGELNVAPGYMINEDGTLNHFMFPHGEVDGQFIPGWGNYASGFSYKYEFKEEDPNDCGC